jgi:cobalt-zinc-cadmium efflux system protein
MAHSHHHHHHEAPNYNRAFGIGVALNVLYVLIEAGFGFVAGSLALLADAGHNLSDVLGLVLAWGGHYLAQLPPTARRTYGWRSSSILAALFNALLLLAAIGGIAWEAIRRFSAPEPLGGVTVMAVAAVGVAVNTATALLFLRGRKHDLNIRGAFLHMAADAAVSVGVVLAGWGILATGWYWLDPAVSLAIALVIFLGTWGLLKDSLNLAMHAVPENIDPGEVREFLAALQGVDEVHDLHIWAMSTTETALTAHLVKPDVGDHDGFLRDVAHALHDRFGIEHATLQLERDPSAAECHSCRARAI